MKRLKLLLGMAALACRVIELDVNGARGELMKTAGLQDNR